MLKKIAPFLFLAVFISIAGRIITNDTIKMKYPVTRKTDSTDVYFGNKIPDPYRWLEDDRSAETGEWVKAQNKVTFDYLGFAQKPNN